MSYRPVYPDSIFIHVPDLVNPKTNKTYREENAELMHNIPIGALVEILQDEYGEIESAGCRLFVVAHERDCDMTPIYSLSIEPSEDFNIKWHNGYTEDMLKVINETPTLLGEIEDD